MIKETVSIEEALEVLNRAVLLDRAAVEDLLNLRVTCNEALASDSEIQIGRYWGESPTLSFLGLLNGIFGEDENWGAICAVFDLRCAKDKKHPVAVNKSLTESCDTCGAELIIGDLIKFVRGSY